MRHRSGFGTLCSARAAERGRWLLHGYLMLSHLFWQIVLVVSGFRAAQNEQNERRTTGIGLNATPAAALHVEL